MIMKPNIFYLIDILFHVLPMKNNLVLFSSFSDQYSDNPKAISEKLHQLYPDVKIAWVVSNRTQLDDIPEYIHKVYINSFKHIITKNRARIIIDNYTGTYSKFTKSQFYLKYKLLKKCGQINYSTWHGTPLKKIGRSIMDRRHDAFFTTSDAFILNSRYVKEIFKRDFTNSVPVILLGSARNDILFRNEPKFINEIKKKIGLDQNIRYVLYAPTFRNHNRLDGSAYSVNISKELIDNILRTFTLRFGGSWSFIYRLHQKISNVPNCIFDDSKIINGNLHEDMADYLCACDALITDFSGSLFDIANTNKPCFLYAPDYSHYEGEERGIYLNIQDLPYSFSFCESELLENIYSYDPDIQRKKLVSFNKFLGNIDDGMSSERIAKLIFRSLNPRKN